MPYTAYVLPRFAWTLLTLLAIWELAWKGVGLWKSARNSQLVWYLAILIFNTAGILPIIYLAFFQRRRQMRLAQAMQPEKRPRRRSRR